MFDHLIGNDSAKKNILRLIAFGRVPNSLLFAGADGVGKKLFALELAKAVVCHQKGEMPACGSCSACIRAGVFELPDADDKDAHKKVFFSEHADVGLIIPYKRNILVDAIRDLEREANFRPFEARARVFIIDEAHKMNDAASNALLKTLEEPPSTSHIFLMTSRPDSLLPTIRSRVQMLRFSPVDQTEIEHLLLKKHDCTQEEARLIARASNGSVALAMSVDPDAFRELHAEAVDVLRHAILDRDIVAVLIQSEKIGARATADFEAFLAMLQQLAYEVWAAKMLHGEGEATTQISELAEAADAVAIGEWINEIERIRGTLAVNINKKSAADALFVKMAAGA